MAQNGTELGSLYYDLDAPTDKLDKSLAEGEKSVKKFGENVESTSEKIADGMKQTAKGFAIAGAGLTLIAKNATDFTVDLVKDSKKLAREIGTSVEEASRLTAALGRVGISSEQASASFGIFSKNIVAASEASESSRLAANKLRLQIEQTKLEISQTSKEIAKNGDSTGELNFKLKTLNNTLESQEEQLGRTATGFDKLNISTKKADGTQKSFNELLFEVADKFQAMPDGVDKTAAALELFGRQGKDMIKVLNLGSDGILELERKADELGLTLNANTIGKVNEFIQSQKDLAESTNALKIEIGTATTPVLTDFNTTVNDVITSLLTTDGVVRDVTVAVLAFGGPVLAGAAAMLQLTANMVQAWPAITGVATALTSLTALSIAGWVALIVADLALLVAAARSVLDAFDAVANAQQAANNLAPEGEMRKLQQQATEARNRGDAAAVKRISNALRAMGGVGANAEGTNSWRGGLTWINEKGPEIVDLPQGTRIIPHDLSKQIVQNDNRRSGGDTNINIGTVQDRSDAEYIMRRADRRRQRTSLGLSPA